MLSGAHSRPDPVPWDPSRPLFESALVGLGTVRMPTGHPELNRDRVAYVWPTISLPRLPYAVSFDREECVQGDRNTATFTSVGSVMRRQGLTERGLWNIWLDVHPDQLAAMLAVRHGGRNDPDSRFPWRFAPLPTAPLLEVTRLLARLQGNSRGGAPTARSNSSAGQYPENAGEASAETAAPTPLEIEEVLLSAIGAIVASASAAWNPPRRRPPSAAQAQFHRDVVDEVRRRLATAPRERHTLDQLARSVHVSPFHLCRIFKRHTGQPIHRYLERLRLRAALDDAMLTRDRMLDIALRHGFCSESHLSNAFFREFGQRPRDARSGRLAQKGQRSVS